LACNSPKPEVVQEAVSEPKPYEFADAKYIEIGKQSLTQLAQGNVDGFVANYDNNATFKWSAEIALLTRRPSFLIGKKEEPTLLTP
jgi:hypothetical protein